MYESFFGLKQAPFRITPDTQAFFGGGRREELLNALLYTVQRGEGMVKVVGEVGSGKTTLLRKLAVTLESNRARLVYINSPNMPAQDILLFICAELGIRCSVDEAKFQLVGRLQEHLLKSHTRDERVVLLIDEAQAMPLDTLEELRLLSNLETDSDKLLQIVMFGQPELDRLLDSAEIRQIKDRIAFSLVVEPFNRSELQAYLNFRLRAAGYIGNDLFSKKVVRKIYRETRGFPRRINLLADKILLAAFSSGGREITSQLVDRAVGEHLGTQKSSRHIWITLTVLLGAFAIGAGIYLYGNKPEFLSVQVEPEKETEKSALNESKELTSAAEIAVEPVPEAQQSTPVWLKYNQQTLEWAIASQHEGGRYTIQIMAGLLDEANNFLEQQKVLQPAYELKLYGFQRKNHQVAVVLAGSYQNAEEVRSVLRALPPEITTRYRPYARTFADVQAELQKLSADTVTKL